MYNYYIYLSLSTVIQTVPISCTFHPFSNAITFNVQWSVHRKYPFGIFPTRCNITQFIYFWRTALHVSGGISTRHQEHIQLYLQYLVLVKPLLLPAAIVEELELVWVWCGNCIDLFWCSCWRTSATATTDYTKTDYTICISVPKSTQFLFTIAIFLSLFV